MVTMHKGISIKTHEHNQNPSSWDTLTIEEVCQLVRDKVKPSSVPEQPYIGLEHLHAGDPLVTSWGNSKEVKSSKGKFQPGDVLYGRLRPYLDKAAIAPFSGICSTDILILRPNQELVLPEILTFVLHTKTFLAFAVSTSSGTNLPRTRWSAIRGYAFPVPPLPEQRAIADVLGAMRRAIESTEAVIAAARELKRSLLEHLFTYGPVPVDQTERIELIDTVLGPINANWSLVHLGEVSHKPQYGFTASARDDLSGPRFLRITDMKDGRVNWTEVPTCEINEQEIDKYRLQKGDVVFARIGATTGKSIIVGEDVDAVFASYLIRVQADGHTLLPEYLHDFAKTKGYWQQIDAAKGGRLKKGVNASVLKSLLMPLPEISVQEEASAILQRLDRKIDVEISRRSALVHLFRSLLNKLVMGLVRVPYGS
jgi:type I restriction enzyme S subunit